MLSKLLLENTLIAIAELFWLSANWSQFRHILKTGSTKGLSAVTTALYAAGNVAWMVYFAGRHLWVPFTTNATMLAITVITLAYILGNRRQFLQGLVAIALISPVTGYLLFAHPSISGWVAAGYNLIAALPGVVKVIRVKKISGVSPRGLAFSVGATLCTLAYASLIGSAPLIYGCTQGLTLQSVTITYYLRYHRSRRV